MEKRLRELQKLLIDWRKENPDIHLLELNSNNNYFRVKIFANDDDPMEITYKFSNIPHYGGK